MPDSPLKDASPGENAGPGAIATGGGIGRTPLLQHAAKPFCSLMPHNQSLQPTCYGGD